MKTSNRRYILDSAFASWCGPMRMVASGVAFLLAIGSDVADCHAQDFPENVSVTKGQYPSFVLIQDNSQGYPERSYYLGCYDKGNNDSGFYILDNTDHETPLWIKGGAPSSSLTVDENGNIGFGKSAPQAKVHAISADAFTSLRLEATNPTSQAWDVSGGVGSFDVVDATNSNAIPFTIQSLAPTDSLFIASNGSVGMGTNAPARIAGKTATGRFINVNADSGLARFVLQGANGGELNVVCKGAATNQKILRIRNTSGAASFNIVKDDLTGDAIANAIVIRTGNGNIGLKVANPTNPLQLASGAFCSSGGVWTNASSRELKEDIQPLTTEQARDAVQKLQPVEYRYKSELDERYVGFIAEDVPALVATGDRKSLSAMDITAVLTRVVQDQDRLLAMERQKNADQQQVITQQQQELKTLSERLARLEQMLDPDR